MNRLLIFFLTCITSLSLSAETRTRFNADWRFILQDDSTFRAPECPDGTWQHVDLPHDWSIAFKPDQKAPAGNEGGYYPTGIGWYRKHFQLTAAEAAVFNRWLYFEGIYEQPDVYVNGKFAGHHNYGYTGFEVDIAELVHEGDNIVAVRVDNSNQKNCRWYSGSGIYRNVWMITAGKQFLSPDNIHVTTPDLQTIVVKTDVANSDDHWGEWSLVTEVDGQT
ncbi:MAG: beta galactosidase jelly roll domain-containing protein, partial [Bacteroidaceae bacterium]|nr:beta galactosidase jelly roll domain-containing protein [Bacteroidaceae bacterium]